MERFAPCCISVEEGKQAVRGHGGGVQTLLPTREVEVVSLHFCDHPQKKTSLTVLNFASAQPREQPRQEIHLTV